MALHDLIGRVANLKVERMAEFGCFLTDGTNDVLLHNNDTDMKLEEGQEVDVFLYTDSQGRIAATTTIPDITADTYGWAEVSDIKSGIGIFINIGINKDMLLGIDDLPVHREVWPEKGDMLYITLKVNKNNRIYVKLATDPVIDEISVKAQREDFNKNIHGFIYRTAKVGSWILTAEGFKGFIHESQRKTEPRLGEKVEGRIVDVKQDGTINVSLAPRTHEALDEDAEAILTYLNSRNGAMPYSDKSQPEDIRERFQLSKASFKRALGRLMKDGKVYQEDGWTYIKKD
jgi:uncharacterized protein